MPLVNEALGYKLNSDEKILLQLKPNKNTAAYFLLAKCGRLILTFFILAAFFYFRDDASPLSKYLILSFNTLFHALHYGIIPITVVLLATLYYGLKKTVEGYDYMITNQRIIIRFGFIVKSSRIIPYKQLNDINSQASVLERFFGLETIYLDTVTNALTRNQRRSANNTTRLEGLTPEVTKEAMEMISQYLVAH